MLRSIMMIGDYLFRINCYRLYDDIAVNATVRWVEDGITVFTWGPYLLQVQDENDGNPDAWWDIFTLVIPSGGGSPYITTVNEDRIKSIEKSTLEMVPKK